MGGRRFIMVIVTDLKFSLDPQLKKKLDLMIKRCTQPNPKRDALLLVEGGEGEGKTNMSLQCAYYFKFKTNRKISLFFKALDVLNFAQSTEEQIIIYDEPALDMLSNEWWKEEQINLVKLLMVARKKRHFIIFNITKFYKFNEYIVVDRSIGLIHVYSRKEIEAGRFVYIRKKAIEWLYNSYKSSKKRDYKKFASFRGTFPDFIKGIIDLDAYELNKDKAILSVGTKKHNKDKQNLDNLKSKIGNIKFPIKTKIEFSKQLDISTRTLQKWAKIEAIEVRTTNGEDI